MKLFANCKVEVYHGCTLISSYHLMNLTRLLEDCLGEVESCMGVLEIHIG